MAVFNKFNQFSKDILDGRHRFSSDTFKIMLTNTLPTPANQVFADIVDITGGGTTGYTAGGVATVVTGSTTGGVAKEAAANVTFTAGAAGMGPFQYAVMYNDTQTSPAKPLVGWWNYGAPITLANTEVLTIAFDATNGVLQAS